jgi:hypothetical protein
MFVAKAATYPSKATVRCSTLRLAPGLVYKHWTRLEEPARDKTLAYLLTFVNYGRKKCYNIGPRTPV